MPNSESRPAVHEGEPKHWCMCWIADRPVPFDGSREKAVALKYAVWPAHTAIRVAFLDGDPSVQARVRKVALEWTADFGGPANLAFNFLPDHDYTTADIRISFQNPGSWSVLGSSCQSVKPKSRPTMNYGWLTPATPEIELRRVVLHEFGHALGLTHEHLNPLKPVKWDTAAVYRDLSGPPNNWDKPTIDSNMFDRPEVDDVIATDFDEQSIMLYPIPPNWTTDGFSVGLNSELSETDKETIARIYPR